MSYGTIDLSGTLVTASGVAACRPRALTVYGSSTQDGTPTPSAPVPIESVEGQLYSWQGMPNRTTNGITWTINADGSIHAKGTATGISYGVGISATTQGSPNRPLLPAGTYTASSPDGATFDVEAMPVGGTNAQVRGFGTAPATFTLAEPSYVFLGVRVASGTVVDADYHIALYAGSTAYPYVPYGSVGLWAKRTSDASTATVTPIDLDGHELRSLPDGTRDEVTVDEYGHAVLVQRVGVAEIGAADWTANSGRYRTSITSYGIGTTSGGYDNIRCTAYVPTANTTAQQPADTIRLGAAGDYAWLGVSSTRVDSTLLYPLATPVTIDIGYVAAVPLCGPDLTAQAVPSAEFALSALLKTGRSTVMWDGEELSAGWTFVSDRREQLLPTDVATVDVPGRDGALFGGVTRAVRQVTLALYVLGPVGERPPHVRELAARLAVDGPRPLMFGDEAPLWRMAVPNAESESEVYYDAEGYTDVEFVCTDPWLYGEERSVTVPSGGSVTFTVGGTAPTWPTITASATGSSGGAWILRLDDSSKGVYAAIASGVTRPVVADCDARTLTVNDATSMLAPSYDWPELTPGTHTLAMTAGTGAATVTWTERWW